MDLDNKQMQITLEILVDGAKIQKDIITTETEDTVEKTHIAIEAYLRRVLSRAKERGLWT